VTGEDVYLAIMDPDPVAASEKYRQLCRQLTRFFEWRGCHDPEELAAEALARGFAKILAGQTISSNPGAYFNGFAKHVAQEEWRRRRPESLEDVAPPASDAAQRALEAAISVKQLLAALPVSDRTLLIRYCDGDQRGRLASELRITPAALRVRVHRIREQLRPQLRLPAPGLAGTTSRFASRTSGDVCVESEAE
jgi:DNA-directed RNA polymerase specialized sigma24 family protein